MRRNPLAPNRIAAARSSRLKVVRTMTRRGLLRRATQLEAKICSVASTPSMTGILMSIKTNVGLEFGNQGDGFLPTTGLPDDLEIRLC